MLLALALALSPARAEVAVVSTLAIVALNPSAEAVDVPVDTRPVVGFKAGRDTSAVVRLTEVGSGTVLFEETLTFGVETRLVTLDPGGELAADTAYRVEVIPDGGEELAVQFTTGTGLAVEVPAPQLPAADNVDLIFQDSASNLVQGTLTLAIDPATAGLATLLVVDPATGALGDIGLPEPGDATDVRFVEFLFDTNPGELCLQAVGVDLAGRQAEGEVVCYEVRTRFFGCSSAPGPMAGVAMGLALLLGLARRRG